MRTILLVMNGIAVLLQLALFLRIRFGHKTSRILPGICNTACASTALLGMLDIGYLFLKDGWSAKQGTLPLLILRNLLLWLAAVLLNLLWETVRSLKTGGKDPGKRWRRFIPSGLSAGLLLLNAMTGFMFRLNSRTLEYEVSPWIILLLLPVLFCLIMTAVDGWRWNRPCGLILGLTGLVALFGFITAHAVSLTVLTTAAALVICLVFELSHRISIQIGVLVLLILTLAVILFLNMMVSATVSTAMKEKRDNELSYLETVEEQISRIRSEAQVMSWLREHPDDALFHSLITDEASGSMQLTSEQIERYRKLYDRLAEIWETMPHPNGEDEYFAAIDATPEMLARLSEEEWSVYAVAMYEYLRTVFTSAVERYHPFRELTLFFIPEDSETPCVILDYDLRNENLPLGYMVDWSEIEASVQRFEQLTSLSRFNLFTLLLNDHTSCGYYREMKLEDGSSVLLYTGIFTDEISKMLGYSNGFLIQFFFTVLMMTVLISFLINTVLLNPVSRLQAAMVTYQEHKDAQEAETILGSIHSENELGRLSGHFVSLTKELTSYTEEITRNAREMARQKAVLERQRQEMELAASIQSGALPTRFPERSEYTLCASMAPAREVGGDFYDFIEMDRDHLALVIADVSGKGIPAALFMMQVKLMISQQVLAGGSPEEILTAVNKRLGSSSDPANMMFVTVWLGILDLRSGKMRCANAGHEYPVLRGPDGTFRLQQDPHGLVLAGVNGIRYQGYTLTLSPGDAVFVYTDGVPEASDREARFYGLDRMTEALNTASQDAPPEEILRAVRHGVDAFVDGAEPFDDLTMMCLIWHGAERRKTEAE